MLGYSSNEHYVLDLFSKFTFSTQMRLAMLRRERIHNCLLFAKNLDNVVFLYNNLMKSYVTGVKTIIDAFIYVVNVVAMFD